MKKFSWIFALILALSIGFIGCPAGGGDDDGGGGGGGGGGPSGPSAFVPNPNATEIAVSFSASNPVSFEKADHSVVGSVAYDNGAYTYTYADKDTENANYGNAIGRFKVDLGDFRLGDYGGFSFGWTGISGDVGLSGGPTTTITYTKNLFILATDDEDALIPYVSDANIKTLVVNTDFYTKTGNAAKDLYDGAIDVPKVRGLGGYPNNQKPAGVTEPYPIATPIKLNKELTGEVWLAFYFHAANDSGSYKISNFKLVPFKDFVQVDPPPPPVAPPPVPAAIPDGFKEIALTLSVANCSDVSGYGDPNTGINTLPTLAADSGALVATFTKNNQRVNVKLSTEDKIKYNANPDSKDKYIQINCEIVGDDNEANFRYHVGIISTGTDFNATTGPGDFPLLKWKGDLGGIAVSTAGMGIKLTKDKDAAPDYFIFQYRGADIANGVTVKIKSISIWAPGEPKGPTVDLSSAIVANTIGKQNVTVTDITGGIKVVTTQGYRWAWTYFKVTLPQGKTVADYETLSYTIKSIEVADLDDGGAWKGGFIYGFDTLEEITDIINDTTENAGELDPDKVLPHPGGLTAREHQLAANGAQTTGTQNHNTDYPHDVKLNTNAAPDGLKTESVGLNQTANTFYIVFSWGGSAGMTYEFKNVKLIAGVKE